MILLITTDEAIEHLRLDDDLDSGGWEQNIDLQSKMRAASSAVLNYLKTGRVLWEVELDSDGDVIYDTDGDPIIAYDTAGDKIMRYEVKAAALILLGYLWKDRDENADGAYEMGYLPKPVMALLYPLRDPVLA